jgi:hypothetical protein
MNLPRGFQALPCTLSARHVEFLEYVAQTPAYRTRARARR